MLRLRIVLFSLATIAHVSMLHADLPQGVEKIASRIDEEIARKLRDAKVPASPLADDAEFLRRAYLDLTGKIPTYEKTLAFLESKDPGKRSQLIDELLASPEYGQHLATTWSNLLLAGDAVNFNNKAAFQRWLKERFNAGDGWDRIVHDMLVAEGPVAKNPATAFILANSENNKPQPSMLAASTTRIFLGVQLQCAECHNHPFTEWKQDEFWAMAAFFARVNNQKATKEMPGGVTEKVIAPKGKKAPDTPKPAIVIPKTAGKAAGKMIPARFLEGEAPNLDDADAYRPALAQWITSADNPFFARAAVNRVWAHLFGRGLVHPVDDFHEENPPSHPELLTLLTEEFRASGYDFKHLIRCIATSQAYQRGSRALPENRGEKALFAHMAVKVMSPEAMYDSLTRALGVSDLKITTGTPTTPGIGGAKKNLPAKSPRDSFIRFFKTADADSLSTDYTHGIPQALSLMNDPLFNKSTPVIEEMVKAKLTPEKAVERMYLTVLSRRPSPSETKAVTAYITRQADVTRGYTGAMWILVNTQEFVLIR